MTFENNNGIIIQGLEMVIGYARDNQDVFLAQSVWWIASIVGLRQGLRTHIDTLGE
jgi:hypothetical protein